MYRKIFVLSALLFLSAYPVAAQNYYVCDGFIYTAHQITEGVELPQDWADIDSITFEEPQYPEIRIAYNGTTATVTIPSNVKGVTCTSGTSSHVVINSTTTSEEYLYTLSGNSSDGSFTVNGDYKLSVKLNGVTLTSSKGAAVDIECGKRIDVLVADGTVNTLVDKAKGSHKAAFYTKGHVEFKGGGDLNVTGRTKHAVSAKEYCIIKASFTGNLNVLGAVSDGIHCGEGIKGDAENNYFQINGGNVKISGCGSDCIDSDDYGCAYINGGKIVMEVSQEDGNGLKVDSILQMKAGEITANITGAISNGIRCSYRASFNGGKVTADVKGNGSRGIRGKKTAASSTTTVANGGFLDFGGTNVTMTVSGKTNIDDSTTCYGIKADQVLTQTAGDISITVTSTDSDTKAITAKTDNWTGGTRNGKTK